MKILRHLGPGGAGGARAPPRIEILLSKNFQNGQNFIFLLFGPTLGKNHSQSPVYIYMYTKNKNVIIPTLLLVLFLDYYY